MRLETEEDSIGAEDYPVFCEGRKYDPRTGRGTGSPSVTHRAVRSLHQKTLRFHYGLRAIGLFSLVPETYRVGATAEAPLVMYCITSTVKRLN